MMLTNSAMLLACSGGVIPGTAMSNAGADLRAAGPSSNQGLLSVVDLQQVLQ